MLLLDRRGPGKHRRQGAEIADFLAFAAGGVRAGIAKLMDHQLPLLGATALFILGAAFQVFAGIGWLILDNRFLTWVMAGSGTVCWMFGLGILLIFPPVPSPRHAQDS